MKWNSQSTVFLAKCHQTAMTKCIKLFAQLKNAFFKTFLSTQKVNRFGAALIPIHQCEDLENDIWLFFFVHNFWLRSSRIVLWMKIYQIIMIVKYKYATKTNRKCFDCDRKFLWFIKCLYKNWCGQIKIQLVYGRYICSSIKCSFIQIKSFNCILIWHWIKFSHMVLYESFLSENE